MKNLFRILAIALCAFAGTTFADDFKSEVIPANLSCPSCPIHVRGDQLMFIRNFTQEGGSDHGVVTATIGTDSASVLQAAIVDPMTSPEVINSVVIAGPAFVDIKCGSDATGNCFVSFKKEGGN
jgi:hypothetical protein